MCTAQNMQLRSHYQFESDIFKNLTPCSCSHSRMGFPNPGPNHLRSVCSSLNAMATLPPSSGPSTVLSLCSRHHLSTGVVYFKDCPQQPNIPNYLLGLALIPLLMIPFVTLPCEMDAARPQEQPRGFRACVPCLISLLNSAWILAGKDEKYQ